MSFVELTGIPPNLTEALGHGGKSASRSRFYKSMIAVGCFLHVMQDSERCNGCNGVSWDCFLAQSPGPAGPVTVRVLRCSDRCELWILSVLSPSLEEEILS